MYLFVLLVAVSDFDNLLLKHVLLLILSAIASLQQHILTNS